MYITMKYIIIFVFILVVNKKYAKKQQYNHTDSAYIA